MLNEVLSDYLIFSFVVRLAIQTLNRLKQFKQKQGRNGSIKMKKEKQVFTFLGAETCIMYTQNHEWEKRLVLQSWILTPCLFNTCMGTKLESLSPGLMSEERRSQGGILTSVSLLCLPKGDGKYLVKWAWRTLQGWSKSELQNQATTPLLNPWLFRVEETFFPVIPTQKTKALDGLKPLFPRPSYRTDHE